MNKDFGVGGTLGGESQPASNRVNDFGCRLRARECWTRQMDYPSAPGEPARITAHRIPLSPLCPVSPRTPYLRRSPLDHDAFPPLVLSRTGGHSPLSLPGRPLSRCWPRPARIPAAMVRSSALIASAPGFRPHSCRRSVTGNPNHVKLPGGHVLWGCGAHVDKYVH